MSKQVETLKGIYSNIFEVCELIELTLNSDDAKRGLVDLTPAMSIIGRALKAECHKLSGMYAPRKDSVEP